MLTARRRSGLHGQCRRPSHRVDDRAREDLHLALARAEAPGRCLTVDRGAGARAHASSMRTPRRASPNTARRVRSVSRLGSADRGPLSVPPCAARDDVARSAPPVGGPRPRRVAVRPPAARPPCRRIHSLELAWATHAPPSCRPRPARRSDRATSSWRPRSNRLRRSRPPWQAPGPRPRPCVRPRHRSWSWLGTRPIRNGSRRSSGVTVYRAVIVEADVEQLTDPLRLGHIGQGVVRARGDRGSAR